MRTTDNYIAAVDLYVVTETGSLFEFGEAETDLANVISYK